MTLRELFRYTRIFILVFILLLVAVGTWLTKLRSTDWDSPLWMVIYPINGDGSAATDRYINYLQQKSFTVIANFIKEEADYFNIQTTTPLQIKLAPTVTDVPPKPPMDGNTLKIMLWSIKLRYWAYTHNTFTGPSPDIKMFVVYFDPQQQNELAHSLGLEKGMLGIVNAYASRLYNQKNNVVITHELLHTLGATDKYDHQTGQPIFPQGYAKRDKNPLYPQQLAEIMGARIPISETQSAMPLGLHQSIIGVNTAKEIGWGTDD